MIAQRVDIARESLDRSLEVREEAGIPFGVPLNVFDVCGLLEPTVRVRFADYSMEGCYVRSARPLIEVSSLRPIGRRAFNTAHELGHHILGHAGMRLDEHLEVGDCRVHLDPEEYAANAFAGFLLMPKIGVRRAFNIRGWAIDNPQPEQVFTVACHFGVGYQTLVSHLQYGLGEIRSTVAQRLRRVQLPAIRQHFLGDHADQRFWVADRHYQMQTLDTEIGTTVLLPANSEAEFDNLTYLDDIAEGRLFRANRPGLTRVEAPDDWAVTVRIARFQYSGWSTNRHLEPAEGDDE